MSQFIDFIGNSVYIYSEREFSAQLKLYCRGLGLQRSPYHSRHNAITAMQFAELLNSITDEERDFIAGLDYGQDQLKHRLALDLVLARGGQVDMEQQYWFPYEAIELGKNWLPPGRDREYAACLAIVLENIRTGADTSTDLEYLIDSQYDTVTRLPSELRQLIDKLLDALI